LLLFATIRSALPLDAFELRKAMTAFVKFKTVFAVPTPFDSSFQICQTALKEHLQALHHAGAVSILAHGRTAEFPFLTLLERETTLELCRVYFPGE
jgi:dihydrodipicolinate synthase/N-acetylneuraminate lyase